MEFKAIVKSFSLSAALLLPTTGYADDTDLYLAPPPGGVAPEPLIMMIIDLKSNNLSSAICTYDGGGADECFGLVGSELYGFLQDAVATYGQDYSTGKVNRFDIFCAVFAAVFDRLITDTPPKIARFGFMLSHNEQTSDGGYMLRGFRQHLAGDSNGAIAELLTKLYSLPDPGQAATFTATPPVACVATAGAVTMVKDGVTFSVNNDAKEDGEQLTFTITGTGTATKAINVNLTAEDDTASAATDYVDYTGSFGVAKFDVLAGETLATVTVNANTDAVFEPVEQLFLQLRSPPETALASGKICNKGAGAEVVIDDVTVQEGTTAQFTVSFSTAPTVDDLVVNYDVIAGSAMPPDIALVSGGEVTLAVGADPLDSITISVPTVADADTSGPETFQVILNSVLTSGGAASGYSISDATGDGTISENSTCADGGKYDHKYQGAELYFELFRYLIGGPVLQGHSALDDFGSNPATNLDTECYEPGLVGALKWDTTIENGAGTEYETPLVNDTECSSVHAIDLMFGVAQQEADLNTTIALAKSANGIDQDLGTSDPFAAMIAWMNENDLSSNDYPEWDPGTNPAPDGDHSVTTHIIKLGGPSGQFTPYVSAGADLREVDQDDFSAIVDAITETITDILSVSTTFVAASIPVQVFNRADVDENVFLALFRTDATSPPKPSWFGNLKKLKLVDDGVTFTLVAADDLTTTAVASDGRVRYDALTFWTDATALPPVMDPLAAYDIDAGSTEQGSKVNQRDGRFVGRGAAGHKIPGFRDPTAPAANDANAGRRGPPGLANAVTLPSNSEMPPRMVYTQALGPDGVASSGDDLPLIVGTDGVTSGDGLAAINDDGSGAGSVAEILQSSFGGPAAADPAISEDYVCYVRGVEDCATGLARTWLMADALHSRPLPVNYGDQ